MQKRNKYKITIEEITTNDKVVIKLSTKYNIVDIIANACVEINSGKDFTFNQIKNKEWNINQQ